MKTFALGLVLLSSLSLFPSLSLASENSVPPAELEPALERLYFGDEIVESANRVPKRVSESAENVIIVTAADIDAMHLHTLDEVLNRLPGLFVQFSGHHFGAVSLPHIQGSGETDFAHAAIGDSEVTVLLDGMTWNALGAGVYTATIPLGIIERIEIVKGPASSTWGSSLGGIINVITKTGGQNPTPTGNLAASYGERNVWDLSSEAAGAVGPVGYYLAGQRQHADWDDAGASYRNWSGFGKAEARLGRRTRLTFSAGKSVPQWDNGDLSSYAALAQQEVQARFARLGLDVSLAESLSFHAAAYEYEQRVLQWAQEDGTYGPRGDLLQNSDSAERHTGGQARLTWVPTGHRIVLGMDAARGRLDGTVDSGAFFQSLGLPAHQHHTPSLWQWGVYANDTMSFGSFALTTGLRFDHPSLSRSFTSPSLGAAWAFDGHTVLRATVARGFSMPSLHALTDTSSGVIANPDLEPEEVWSYQLGVETAAFGVLWFKADVFRHEVQGSFAQVPSSVPDHLTWENADQSRRTGVDVAVQTARFFGLSAKTGFAYVQVDPVGAGRSQDVYQAKAELSYSTGPWKAQAFGLFAWWDLGRGAHESSHDDFLWNASVTRTFLVSERLNADVFVSVHNVFNGDQDFDTDRGNESRWVESGIRVEF